MTPFLSPVFPINIKNSKSSIVFIFISSDLIPLSAGYQSSQNLVDI